MIEKKNGLNYLSWASAVDVLLTHDVSATWEYPEPKQYGETLMVFCTVTAFGKSMTAQLPVMDYRNRAIPNPDAFSVNTAMQRCLAKAISLHGIGLYIYAGEDFPTYADRLSKEDIEIMNKKQEEIKEEKIKLKSVQLEDFDEEEQEFLKQTALEINDFASHGLDLDAYNLTIKLTNDEKLALWTLLDSKSRSALKKQSSTNLKAVA
jgi:hypothetical protein